MLPTTPPQPGLTNHDARQRLRRPLHIAGLLRSLWSYVRAALVIVFTPLNTIILGLAVLLWWFGAGIDAAMTAGVVCVNVLVNIVQALRAIHTLQAISLASAPVAMVWREGALGECASDTVVTGDVVLLRPGDHVVADGVLLAATRLTVDESMYTGEHEPVPHDVGAVVRAGSTCVTGAAWYRVTETVHALHLLNAVAQRVRLIDTPLSRTIQQTVQRIVLLAGMLIVLVLIRDAWLAVPWLMRIQHATVMAGLIPNALVLALTLSYALAAIAMTRAQVLVQQLPAVEALASIDVLCIDKTGTLTSNALTLTDVHVLGGDATLCRHLLARFVRADVASNRTNDAICAGLRAVDVPAVALDVHVPFDSQRKWSLQATASDTWVLGAPDVVALNCVPAWVPDAHVQHAIDHGARVLLFAHTPHPYLHDIDNPLLPQGLTACAVVVLYDEIRADAATTIATLHAAGVDVYILSGDDPNAVAALARRVGVVSAHAAVHGSEFAMATPAQQRDVVATARVFGRTTPSTKAQIISMVQARGYRVAMVGDGYNDIPALKTADVAVVLQSARGAVRDVADVVLLADNLASLIALRQYGQRIVMRMSVVLQHFVMRVGVSAACLVTGLYWGEVIWKPFDSAMLALWGVALPSMLLIVAPVVSVAPWLVSPHHTRQALYALLLLSVLLVSVCAVLSPAHIARITWWWCVAVLWVRLLLGIVVHASRTPPDPSSSLRR